MTAPHRLREIVSAEAVARRLDELAEELLTLYPEEPPLFVVIAEGARRYASALIERLQLRGRKPETLIVRAKRTSGTELVDVELEDVAEGAFAACDVLILDDIADEGRTLQAVQSRVARERPTSVRVSVLVNKTVRRKVPLQLDQIGFHVEDGWVVGFGMDLDGRHRDLDMLAVAEFGSGP